MKPPYFWVTQMDGDREVTLAEVPATEGRNGWFWRGEIPAGDAQCVYVMQPEGPDGVRGPMDRIVGHLAQGDKPVTLATLRDLGERGVLDRVCFGTVDYWGPV